MEKKTTNRKRSFKPATSAKSSGLTAAEKAVLGKILAKARAAKAAKARKSRS